MKEKKKIQIKPVRSGSALIMTMVLTVMLAIVAVMFVSMARMDRAATSNIADNMMLESAVKSLVEIIDKELVLDTPGVAKKAGLSQAAYPRYYDYWDYPDANDAWLASIEPYLEKIDGTYKVYRWRQISDVTSFLKISGFEVNDIGVDPVHGSGPFNQDVIKDYPDISLNTDGTLKEQLADADGDGIADSKWIELADLRSSKGQRIYAAVRIIDNGGMVNVNTAHTFDPTGALAGINGKSQMQINLKGLLKDADTITKLHQARCGTEPNNWADYEKDIIWDYNSISDTGYLPFDISDELELKYRYCIDSKFISRFEANMPNTIKTYGNPGSLYDASSDWGLIDWQNRIADPNFPAYASGDRRHLLTAYSVDRIIDPNGDKMLNVNTVSDPKKLYRIMRKAIRSTNPALDANIAAQIAVNIIDYRDTDSDVNVFHNPDNGKYYYGFERPCAYISELAYRQVTDLNIPETYKSYAIELYKPDFIDQSPNGWQLLVNGIAYDVNWLGTKHFYVIKWENSNAPFAVSYSDANVRTIPNPLSTPIFNAGNTIALVRKAANGENLVVDSNNVPAGWPPSASGIYDYRRNITMHKCMRRLWQVSGSATLGSANGYTSPLYDYYYIQAHPANSAFTNIGDIGMVFRKAAYYPLGASAADKADAIGYSVNTSREIGVRLNLADPNYQQIFRYLTVMDPHTRNPANDVNETRIKGRININTASAYTIAQLPWVSKRKSGSYNGTALAKAIIAYRDKTAIDSPPYTSRTGIPGFTRSIGQLCNVNVGGVPEFRIDYYGRDIVPVSPFAPIDQNSFPDLTFNDGAANDFEERDLIFARVSDLVTIRSDIFTAYILVRIGVDGPQKRYMVILDRSGVKKSSDKVRIIAFQSVPEAR
ncbi:MAG: hypothetical protein WC496_00405 [Phycisphaerae bacterium]|jgi:hypothetical protein